MQLEWQKSSYSTGTGGDCVEVATTPYAIAVRDTKNRTRGQLAVSREAWRTFLSSRHVTGS